jgi:hypothetical protein
MNTVFNDFLDVNNMYCQEERYAFLEKLPILLIPCASKREELKSQNPFQFILKLFPNLAGVLRNAVRSRFRRASQVLPIVIP